MVNFDDYIQALRYPIVEYNSKIELLDLDENVIKELPAKLIKGSVSDTYQNGSRRSCIIELENSTREFSFESGSDIFLNKKIRVYTGINLKSWVGQDIFYYISQGIFRIGEPEEMSRHGEKIVRLNLYDKFSFLDGTLSGDIQYDYIIDSGVSIKDAVKAIFLEAEEVKPVIIGNIPDVLPYSIVKRSGTLGDMLIELANLLTWSVYYDTEGFPRFEPSPDVNKDNSVWDFDNVKYIGARKRIDTTTFRNSVRVVGANINGIVFHSLSEDNNPLSPISTVNIGKYTERIEDDNIYNQDLADDRSEYELQTRIAFSESVDITLAPVTHIVSGDIITLTDENLGLNKARFLVQSVPIELMQSDSMTIKGWRIRTI